MIVKMKRFLAAFLSLLLLLSFSSPLCSAEAPPVSVITSVGDPINPTSVQILFLSQNGDPASLELPDSYVCVKNGRWGYSCPVEWNLAALDSSKPGLHYIPGLLQPEGGYSLAEGLSPNVRYPVYVEGPDPETKLELKEIFYELPDSFLVPTGSRTDSLNIDCGTAYGLTETFGEFVKCDISWDFGAVDMAIPGRYPVYGTPNLSDEIVFPPDFNGFETESGIVSPDYVDLSAGEANSFPGYIHCRWLYSIQDQNSVKLEYSLQGENGPWLPDPSTEPGKMYYAYYASWSKYINFDLSRLEPGKNYYFRLTYDENQISNTICLRTDGNEPTFQASGMGGDRDGSDQNGGLLPPVSQPAPGDPGLLPGISGGDRDGDDQENQQIPGYDQTISTSDMAPLTTGKDDADPSSPPSEEFGGLADSTLPHSNSDQAKPLETKPTDPGREKPAVPLSTEAHAQASVVADAQSPAVKAPVLERVTDISTTLSGIRLRQLAASSKTVLFEKKGIAVELFSSFLNTLSLGDEELLEVTIEQPQPDSFRLTVVANGKPVTELPDTTVRIPWKKSETMPECVDSTGSQKNPAVYSSETGMISCTIHSTGTFRLQSPSDAKAPAVRNVSAVPQNSSSESHSSLLLSAVLLSAAFGMEAIRRKRHE